MARYVAFLRGINVGGHRISSPELRAHFVDMGFREVATFRASGNVVFDVEGDAEADALTLRIEEALVAALGYEVPTFLRTADETRAISGYEPFAPELVAASKGKLQVALLREVPGKRERTEALAYATDEDRLEVHGRELYWLPSGGISDSELDLAAIGKLVGLTTMRTKGTVDLIAAKYLAE